MDSTPFTRIIKMPSFLSANHLNHFEEQILISLFSYRRVHTPTPHLNCDYLITSIL